jgi:hypothetical protein
MKYIFLLLFACFSSLIVPAQNKETKLFPLNTYINTKKSGLSEDAISLLSNKINAITSNLGIGGENLSNPRFLLYSKVIINKKNVIPGSVTGYTVYADVYLYVGDAFEKTIFSSQVIPVKGYGTSEESAIFEALRSINPKDEKFKTFISSGVEKINNYIVSQCPIIIARAKAKLSEQKFDEAIFNLYSIPDGSGACYQEALALIKTVYNDKINAESSAAFKKAKLVWAASQTASSLSSISEHLSKVNPGSAAFAEVDNFIAEINKKIDNNITRDWLDKQQEKKDALEKEKYKMEIEKSQIEAAKQIAIAYASGTYITNNYSTSNYSASYSSPYYTVRIYDTLIW